MNIVVPCDACAQFVRRTETACPFCGEARAPSQETPPRSGLRSRLAAIAGAALLMGACGGGDAEAGGSGDGSSGGEGVHGEGGGGDGSGGDGLGDAEASCAGRCGSHHSPACMDDDDPCPAPPYGTPPAEDMIV